MPIIKTILGALVPGFSWVNIFLWLKNNILILSAIVLAALTLYGIYHTYASAITRAAAAEVKGAKTEVKLQLQKANVEDLKKTLEKNDQSQAITQEHLKAQDEKKQVIERNAQEKTTIFHSKIKEIKADPVKTEDQKSKDVSAEVIDDLWSSFCDLPQNSNSSQCVKAKVPL
jgi:2-oxoglutarate dehydrogenase complex dehydrogenase (E1) component-like enzyme